MFNESQLKDGEEPMSKKKTIYLVFKDHKHKEYLPLIDGGCFDAGHSKHKKYKGAYRKKSDAMMHAFEIKGYVQKEKLR